MAKNTTDAFDTLTGLETKAILQLVHEGKGLEAQVLLKKSMGSEKKARAKDLTDTLEKSSPEQVDYKKYLLHAPAEARVFFKSMTSEHQADAMKHIEYLPHSIIIKDDNGNVIAELDNKDLTAPEQPGKIETVNGVTYFQRDAMMDYTKENNIQVPSEALYEKMLRVMPAGDYKGKYQRCQAGLQLYRLLGGKLSRGRHDGKEGLPGYGYFWSSSENTPNSAFALSAGRGESILYDYSRKDDLFPVRALRTA